MRETGTLKRFAKRRSCRRYVPEKGPDTMENILISACLPTPREPSERQGCAVVMKSGTDVTAQYRRGAEQTLHLARLYGCKAAVLKERSPSCGSGRIYDGTFSGRLTSGDGVTAALLKENGITVYGESEIEALLSQPEPDEPQQSLF